MKGTKYLITNSDDFGQSEEVNQGVIRSHERGIVTSASLMVNMAYAKHAALLSKSYPNLSVGMHINLTYGKPVSKEDEVPSLLDGAGLFRRRVVQRSDPSEKHIRKAIKRVVDEFEQRAESEEVKREVMAQFDLFRKTLGHLPTHLDSHHHLHESPEVLKVVAQLAVRYNIPVRQTNPRLLRQLRNQGVATADYFIDRFWGIGGREPMMKRLLTELRKGRTGVTEILFHPGLASREAGKLGSPLLYDHQRQVELDVLCDRDLREGISRLGFSLIGYRELREIFHESPP